MHARPGPWMFWILQLGPVEGEGQGLRRVTLPGGAAGDSGTGEQEATRGQRQAGTALRAPSLLCSPSSRQSPGEGVGTPRPPALPSGPSA